MIYISNITGLSLAYLLICWGNRIRKETRLINLRYRSDYMAYVETVKEEIKNRFNISWTLFYEAYLFVYTNQSIIPNDTEINKFRDMFKGYFKMKLNSEEVKRYMEVFNDEEDKFDSYVDYMFMQKCQAAFFNPALEAIAEASASRRSK